MRIIDCAALVAHTLFITLALSACGSGAGGNAAGTAQDSAGTSVQGATSTADQNTTGTTAASQVAPPPSVTLPRQPKGTTNPNALPKGTGG